MPRSPLPVLFMVQHLDSGGTEHHFHDLVTRLDRDLIAPHVIYCEPGIVSRQLEALDWLPVTRIPLTRAYDWSGLRAALRVRRYLRRHAIGAVVAFHFVADFLAVLAAWPGPLPVISSRRDMGFTRTSRQIRIGRWMQPRIHRYIAVSGAVAEAVARDEAVPPGKISVIHNGIDLDRLHREKGDAAAERARLGIAPGELVIGCAATFNPVKRHDLLLEAFARLRRAGGPPVRLLLAGDGPLAGEIAARRRALGLERAVLMVGRSPRVARELNAADIVALASETEGFSNAIIQAMALGRPVVACRVGGNPEAVHDGATGLLVPPNDPAAFAAALERLVADEPLRREMGRRAAELAAARFSLQAMVERTQSLILAAARPAALE